MDKVDSTGSTVPASSSRRRRGKRHGSRYKARRRAVELLFEGEARNTDPVDLADERNQLALDPEAAVAPVAPYTRTLVEGVAVNLDFIDDAIVSYLSDGWELDRIAAVDRAILRVAFFELVFNPDVPVKTAVVEATELGFQYSGVPASRYINALMDRAAHDYVELRRSAAALIASEAVDEPDQSQDAIDHADEHDNRDAVGFANDSEIIGGLYVGPTVSSERHEEAGSAQEDHRCDVRPIGGLYLGTTPVSPTKGNADQTPEAGIKPVGGLYLGPTAGSTTKPVGGLYLGPS